MEQDTGFTVTDDLVVLVRVKFNPELVLVSLSSQELDGADGAFFFLVGPIPKRHSLISVSSEGDDVLVISWEIHIGDTIWVRVEVSADGSSSSRIPNNEHGVFTRIGSDHPSLVFRASNSSNLIAMTLEESLSLMARSVVVDDTGMSSGIENFLNNMLNPINCHLRFCHFHRRWGSELPGQSPCWIQQPNQGWEPWGWCSRVIAVSTLLLSHITVIRTVVISTTPLHIAAAYITGFPYFY